MKFEVMSQTNARRYSMKPHDERTIMISINDCENEGMHIINRNNRNNIQKVLYMYFDDVESGTGVITSDQATKIVQFIKACPDNIDKIIVHCGAGVSRSAGCCAAIMKFMTGSDMQIFDSPKYCPNMRVYREVLNAFYSDE